MSKGIKCRSLLSSKAVMKLNRFKIKMEKIKHGYSTKQLIYSVKSKVDTTMHSYQP